MKTEAFFVGGSYAGVGGAAVMHGQMFVEGMRPDTPSRPCPLVMLHGNWQTAASWMTTPDGRPGWGAWFVEQGWHVYLVGQPGRGRSAWQPGFDGALAAAPVQFIERFFTAPAEFGLWPQARLHKQWPGGANKGRAGDPVFDQFFASQVPSMPRGESERAMVAAGAALLNRIGPCVLIAHSQAAAFAWLMADARPGRVKGIVALEPAGPPYRDAVQRAGSEERAFGLTTEPLTYEPPVTEASPLSFKQAANAGAPGLAACWLQAGEPRRLVNLVGVPTVIVTGEASYHAAFDHGTVDYLRQAGVAADFIRLEEVGLCGNGHMFILEKNSLEIAAVVDRWLQMKIAPAHE